MTVSVRAKTWDEESVGCEERLEAVVKDDYVNTCFPTILQKKENLQ